MSSVENVWLTIAGSRGKHPTRCFPPYACFARWLWKSLKPTHLVWFDWPDFFYWKAEKSPNKHPLSEHIYFVISLDRMLKHAEWNISSFPTQRNEDQLNNFPTQGGGYRNRIYFLATRLHYHVSFPYRAVLQPMDHMHGAIIRRNVIPSK
jgi:hypothetical protein